MKCYEFIGALIARTMVKDHLWFGVPMAPTFWMISKNENPTLEDFAKEDARLQKRLKKLADGNFNEEFWDWQDSSDDLKPISSEIDKPVTLENLAEFQSALLDKLIREGAE